MGKESERPSSGAGSVLYLNLDGGYEYAHQSVQSRLDIINAATLTHLAYFIIYVYPIDQETDHQ